MTNLNQEIKPEYYSISRLKTYQSCPRYYYNKYVQNLSDQAFSSSLFTGSLTHLALEEFYKEHKKSGNPKSLTHYLEEVLPSFLLQNKMCTPESANDLAQELIGVAKTLLQLYIKADVSYVGKDSIRKADGGVASKPQATKAWKNFIQENVELNATIQLLNLELSSIIKIEINNRKGELSLVDLFSNIYYATTKYVHNPRLKKTLDVEIGISDYDYNTQAIINPLLMPTKFGGKDNVFFKAYIDLIVEDDEGKVIILDHKTNKTPFSYDDLLYNVQLMSYVWAYQEVSGRKVDYIGINNVTIADSFTNSTSNSLVIREVPDKDYIERVLNNLFSVHIPIKNNYYPFILPEPYSKCLKTFEKPCPFLGTCWPDKARTISNND